MQGAEKSPRSEFVYYSSQGALNGLRQGDFKLRIIEGKNGKGTVELYNLTDDIGEANNLAESMPDKVATLKERMAALHADITKDVRPRGQE
jgi:arylsulfatase A